MTGPTKRQAAGPEWRRSSRGLYVPAEVDLTAAQRVLEAGVLLPRRTAVTGWGALAWRNARWFEGRDAAGDALPVPVAVVAHRIRPQTLLDICAERFDPREMEVIDGIAVTSPVRSVCFEARHARGLERAVEIFDAAAYDDLTSLAELGAWIDRHPSYTGIQQCRDALPLADENAWSPRETHLRLTWDRITGQRPLTNRPLFDLSGRHIGTPDIVDVSVGLVGEYDGALHLSGSRRAVDLQREARFRAHGIEYVTMVAADVREPAAFCQRLREAYARAAASRTARTWTLTTPIWWRDTVSVEQRRALVGDERARLLGHRSA